MKWMQNIFFLSILLLVLTSTVIGQNLNKQALEMLIGDWEYWKMEPIPDSSRREVWHHTLSFSDKRKFRDFRIDSIRFGEKMGEKLRSSKIIGGAKFKIIKGGQHIKLKNYGAVSHGMMRTRWRDIEIIDLTMDVLIIRYWDGTRKYKKSEIPKYQNNVDRYWKNE